MREGVEAASIRRVADEAGWSTGSLRHYFATQSDLLSFAMELVTRRAHALLRGLCRQITTALGARDPALAAERLHALVDGLALHAVLAPGTTTPGRQRELLAVHLEELPRR